MNHLRQGFHAVLLDAKGNLLADCPFQLGRPEPFVRDGEPGMNLGDVTMYAHSKGEVAFLLLVLDGYPWHAFTVEPFKVRKWAKVEVKDVKMTWSIILGAKFPDNFPELVGKAALDWNPLPELSTR